MALSLDSLTEKLRPAPGTSQQDLVELSAPEHDRVRAYGTTGGILLNLYSFVANGGRLDLPIEDPVSVKRLPARGYFLSTRGCPAALLAVAVRAEMLPFDADMKAVYFRLQGRDQYKPTLEVTAVDFKRLAELLQERFPGLS